MYKKIVGTRMEHAFSSDTASWNKPRTKTFTTWENNGICSLRLNLKSLGLPYRNITGVIQETSSYMNCDQPHLTNLCQKSYDTAATCNHCKSPYPPNFKSYRLNPQPRWTLQFRASQPPKVTLTSKSNKSLVEKPISSQKGTSYAKVVTSFTKTMSIKNMLTQMIFNLGK